jgi:hypothetical protein
MNTIRFKTVVHNGIIRIPDEHKEFSDKKVEVVLLIQDNTQERKKRFMASVKKHKFRLPSDYRFDREVVETG